MHRLVLHNEQICDAADRVLSPGQVGLLAGWGVFTTLKVVDGVLFAFERHWARMTRDAARMHICMPEDSHALEARLLELVERNQASNATMRLVVVRNRGGMWQGPAGERESDAIALTTDLKDWGESVKLTVVQQARHSGCMFAGTKVNAWGMNLTWLEEAQSRGFDEAILLNERGEVSECTSANIFVAKGARVSTPPLDSSGCLPGITRELLISEIHAPEVQVIEKVLTPEDLESADEVFITSTTRDLLPVDSVDGRKMSRNDQARERLQQAFTRYVREYVDKKKNGSK